MSELTTSHLALYAVVIIATMAALDWLESRRSRIARAFRQRREQVQTGPAIRLPEHTLAHHHRRRTTATRRTA
jgi:hypothetical protein